MVKAETCNGKVSIEIKSDSSAGYPIIEEVGNTIRCLYSEFLNGLIQKGSSIYDAETILHEMEKIIHYECIKSIHDKFNQMEKAN